MLSQTIVGGTAPTLASNAPGSVGPGSVWSGLTGGTQSSPLAIIPGALSPGPPTLHTIDNQKKQQGLSPGTVLRVQGPHDRREANQVLGPPREDQAQRTAGIFNVKGGQKSDVPGLERQGNVQPGIITNLILRDILNR